MFATILAHVREDFLRPFVANAGAFAFRSKKLIN
jgi:hypothetical protein